MPRADTGAGAGATVGGALTQASGATADAAGTGRTARRARIGLALYAVALAAIAFWPTHIDRDAGPLLRLITELAPALTYSRIEFAANIVLFVPLGLLLTLALARNRWIVLPIAFVTTVTIECGQALMGGARTPSVLDIVANTAGACVGILLAVFVEALQRGRTMTPNEA